MGLPVNKIAQQIISTIKFDATKIQYHDHYDMCETEFEIYEWLEQKEDRLGFLPYHTWICTDTGVGINVLYLDLQPVAISYQMYRKSGTEYYWIDAQSKKDVFDYLTSLRSIAEDENVQTIDEMGDILASANSIDYKQHEAFYVE